MNYKEITFSQIAKVRGILGMLDTKADANTVKGPEDNTIKSERQIQEPN